MCDGIVIVIVEVMTPSQMTLEIILHNTTIIAELAGERFHIQMGIHMLDICTSSHKLLPAFITTVDGVSLGFQPFVGAPWQYFDPMFGEKVHVQGLATAKDSTAPFALRLDTPH